MKECSYCGEKIQDSAKKCRYCGEGQQNTVNAENITQKDNNKGNLGVCKKVCK